MKPWREVVVPHKDVLEGTFQQSEFAADISAVRAGRATREYQDATAFFERTFITEGMRLLLTQVAQRLNGSGGEPVIQLQTAFGGGKTHTMLAVFHLATRPGSLQDLQGIPALLDAAGMMDVPRARVAILDGTAHAPGQPWQHDGVKVHTLWGELACQLGGSDAYQMVKEADVSGTSPGKESLRELLTLHAPCVILIDELVAYVRQFHNAQALSGGTYDSNLSFVQALTEATKLVPGAIVLASLPESEVEAGSSRGVAALRALEKTFGRVQALWKPVATEEAFEIVRRRLFEPVRDPAERDAVCRAFAQLYAAEGARLPSETHEARYLDRLFQAYPIHPEVFDRLYEDWTTLDGFQRTRGVLKLMARVIFKLWKDQNRDLMIMPGSLPLFDGGTRNELIYHLPPGWDPVVEKDIDGDRAEATELDTRETRFGPTAAARRVARTLFLGSAPSSVGSRAGARGIDRARVLLGCLQPGQTSSTYSDALGRLADRLHYLNSSGDKTLDSTRYWFDTRANLRREMEDRKGRFDDKTEVRGKIAEIVQKLLKEKGHFDGIHPFTPHSDVPDDGGLRLVVLGPGQPYGKQDPRVATEAVVDYVRNNGARPRFKSNRLLFLAPDQAALTRMRDAVRAALAWASITQDINTRRLNIDRLQEDQARKEHETSELVAERAARECYKWLLSPVMHQPTDREIIVEAFPVSTIGASLGAEIGRVCEDNELVVTTWSPIHLSSRLKELYWRADRPAVSAVSIWEDMQKYLYLPRLKARSVFDQAVLKGTSSEDFYGTAYGQEGEHFVGFKFGISDIQVDGTLLLIHPEHARAYKAAEDARRREAQRLQDEARRPADPGDGAGDTAPPAAVLGEQSTPVGAVASLPPNSQGQGKTTAHSGATRPTSYFASFEVKPGMAKVQLVGLAEEIIQVLTSDPRGTVKISLEVQADYPEGVRDDVKRAVNENVGQLGYKGGEWG